MRKQPAAGRWLVLLALLAAARLTPAVLHPDEWAFEARRMYVGGSFRFDGIYSNSL